MENCRQLLYFNSTDTCHYIARSNTYRTIHRRIWVAIRTSSIMWPSGGEVYRQIEEELIYED